MRNFVLAFLLTFLCTSAFADKYLLEEMESLKASLEKNDPDRVELSLRLADVYFDSSIQEGDDVNIIPYRKKALKLYKDVLYGRDGLTKSSLKKAVVIKYQIARVLGKLGEIQKAKKYYHEVYNAPSVAVKMKREAAFSLAEFYEEDVNFKKADEFYMAAVGLCESVSSCNYAHYKRAWLYYKELKLPTAISELKLALWDKNKVARDKIINDLLLFFSAATTDGSEELAFMQDLAVKTKRPNLVRRLVESFYGAGNRVAGMNVLEAWNQDNPSLFYEARLLEENYGFRDWDKMRVYLSKIEKRTEADLPKSVEEQKNLKAMFKRVIVQVDSEATEDKQYNNDLLRSIDIYLGFYPRDDMREKLQEGWLKAQNNELAKMQRLGQWISEDQAAGVKTQRIIKLRKTRLALAQNLDRSDIVLIEAPLIAAGLSAGEDKRRFRYIRAHELYKAKKYDESLPIFLELAEISEVAKPDEWAVKSQNLSLDIYNIKKDFSAMVMQAKTWTGRDELKSDKLLKKELAQMDKVAIDAEFQRVFTLGETKEALTEFTRFCFDGIYSEKSCPNAKVLSIKLKDQMTLVRLLEKAHDENALLVEYERMGEFEKAAQLFQKLELKRNSDLAVYLKSALLYELGQNFKKRDTILKKLIAKVKRDKKIEQKWVTPLYLTLDEAGLISGQTLTLPWPTQLKLKIAERLQANGNLKSAKRLIASQKTYTGPSWSKQLLAKIQKLDQKQKKMSFYGKNSKRRFERKVAGLEKLATEVKVYLDGSDLKTRVYLLDMAKKAYLNFSVEIMSTPLPEGLTPEILTQVQANLTQMAAPYSTVAADFENLQKTQLLDFSEIDRNKMLDTLEREDIDYASLIEIPKSKSLNIASLDFSTLTPAMVELNQNPNQLETLSAFESFYKENKSARLASYFTGRINSLKDENE